MKPNMKIFDRMKLFKKIAYTLCGVVAMGGCSMLDTSSPSSFDDATVFSKYDLAEFNIFSIYEALSHQNSYRGRYLPWYGFNTDVELYNGTNTYGNELARYDTPVTNSQLNLSNGPYNEMYGGIERANLCISGLRQYGNTGSDKNMAYLLGEALTLRAMLYFDLIKGWGDVPARFSPVEANSIYLPKADRDVIYKQILADLEEAIGYLPMPKGSTPVMKTDRVSRAFAEGLYARIALSASGYALRPDDGTVGTGNEGSVRLSSDEQLSKDVLYPKALAYLKDVIENANLSLVDYKDLWYGVNNLDIEAGKEIIFVIPFGNSRGRWNFTFAVNADGASFVNGKASSGGQCGPAPTMYFDFDANDVRRDITCVNFKWNKNDEAESAGIYTWYFGKFRFEWMDVQPYTGGNDDGVKPVVMRYSDILLMAAEIANELDELGAAKDYLLPVRERAFKGNEYMAETYVNSISSKADMFNAIVDERAFEFSGEFLRKNDLIRWNLLKEKLDETKAKFNRLVAHEGEYAYLPTDVYSRFNEDEMILEFYGFNPGESDNPGDGWTLEKNYIKSDSKKQDKIDKIYELDPNTRQYWPIFRATLDNSQGSLVNDFGY